MLISIDQLGHEVQIATRPQRIVSLVPSITELLCDLGLAEQIVGCTKFCVHPSGIRKSAMIVGGTKQLHLERIKALSPDLIIANKEENNKKDILLLKQNFPVWVSEVSTLEDAGALITAIGKLFDRKPQASAILAANRSALSSCGDSPKGRVVYLIWRDPYMSVGGDTYIHDVLTKRGYTNACADQTRYPTLTIAEMQQIDPDYLLLSSEPFPFKQRHLNELAVLFPRAKIELVDGEFYSWYGSRLSHY